jgi:hypothetical protein
MGILMETSAQPQDAPIIQYSACACWSNVSYRASVRGRALTRARSADLMGFALTLHRKLQDEPARVGPGVVVELIPAIAAAPRVA